MSLSAREEGYIACVERKPVGTCPYPSHACQQRIDWLEGWLTAHQTCIVPRRPAGRDRAAGRISTARGTEPYPAIRSPRMRTPAGAEG